MKLVIASNNKKKIDEMRGILENLGFEVLSLEQAGLSVNPEETGVTFQENALIKAQAVMRASGLATIADDSGIEVAALAGEPGIHSARYGGDRCKTDEDRTRLLLKNMEHVSERAARFTCAIACLFPNGDTITASGQWYGEILREPAGTGGFGYDPVFYDRELGMSAAEMQPGEKNKISHRAKALNNFMEKMERYYANR